MQITLSYPTAVLSLADVTADPGVDRVTIDIPKDEMKGHVDTLLQFGFKIHRPDTDNAHDDSSVTVKV